LVSRSQGKTQADIRGVLEQGADEDFKCEMKCNQLIPKYNKKKTVNALFEHFIYPISFDTFS
jgi:hypothetical protein